MTFSFLDPRPEGRHSLPQLYRGGQIPPFFFPEPTRSAMLRAELLGNSGWCACSPSMTVVTGCSKWQPLLSLRKAALRHCDPTRVSDRSCRRNSNIHRGGERQTSPLTYQWYSNGTPISGANTTGGTTPAMTEKITTAPSTMLWLRMQLGPYPEKHCCRNGDRQRLAAAPFRVSPVRRPWKRHPRARSASIRAGEKLQLCLPRHAPSAPICTAARPPALTPCKAI